ncbi:hypothetical protein [Kaistia sp. MMO-174]|uniref:hypothetical protein n=1 Tax=Kaistia sp. MMO-174 TaxID=3081256 RepID=UPI003017C4D4
MTTGNPFSNMLPAGFSGGLSAEQCDPLQVITFAAEGLWDVLDGLPDKATGTLAKRRLQETVFWAGQAASTVMVAK